MYLLDMVRDLDIVLTPEEASDDRSMTISCAKRLRVDRRDITAVQWLRRSIDSRRPPVRIAARLRVYIGQPAKPLSKPTCFRDADPSRPVIIVGAGPAGLFAALRALEVGMFPIVLERGCDVHQRRRDVARLNREGVLDEESNYAFGEGGAGAFSDGKLYTRSVKRGDVSKVLSLFVQHGAKDEILFDSHPHIGSDVLPKVIENIRGTILAHGGQVHFRTRVTGLVRTSDEVRGVVCADGREFHGPVVLATGHSARDVYAFLRRDGYTMSAKDVAVGVRLEHPQSLIDRMQYHSAEGRGRFLPPASYSFVTQVDGRGVYSFCMCPGGFIVPASSEQGALVVNGMSPSNRGGRWADSGIVVQLRVSDIPYADELSMLEYISSIERRCFSEGFKAPAQRMTDFLEDRLSSGLPRSSYVPGLVSRRMDDVLPDLIAGSLRRGLGDFVRKSHGLFLCEDALLIAPETRTSSPVRIERGPDFCQMKGFYPCGEGAGHAGGIVSAALDGIACIDALGASY